MISIDKHTLSEILIYTFRYCLGRRTYAVNDCVEYLHSYWDVLPTNWQELIHKEINEAIDRNDAGADFDVRNWHKVLELPIRV